MSDCKICKAQHPLFATGDRVRALYDLPFALCDMPFAKEKIEHGMAYDVLAADEEDGVGMVRLHEGGQWLLACNFLPTNSP